jgi:ribosome maturation factor RimP
MFAFEKLPGLPRDRILEAITPVLRAHGLAGVELIWRTDGQGRVLQVTLEKSASDVSGQDTRDASSAGGPSAGGPPGGGPSAGELSAGEQPGGVHDAGEATGASDGSEAEAASAPAEAAAAELGGLTLDVCSKVSRDLSTALDVLELIDGQYRLEVGSPGLERRLYTLADYRRFRGRLAKLKLASAIAGQYVLLGKLDGVDAEDRVLIVVDGVEHVVKLEDVRSGQLAIDWQQMGFSPTPRQRAGRRSAAQGRK